MAISTCICPFVRAQTDTEPIAVAVLNFTNRSVSGEWQWLSKGLADMIITDLSASERLILVERERLNEIVAELQLIRTTVFDSSIADQVGQVAKADWVLFGSFLKEGDHLKIEAHILDLKTQELLRVEWVEGPAEEVMKLEKRLVQQLLERLDVPVTEEEQVSIMYVPTDSIAAFEHYSKSLDFFDNGQWLDAMLELRLATRQDPNFIKARGRIADLYYQLNKPEHALVEYQGLVRADRDNIFPEHIYYKMGRLLEERKRDFGAAVILYRKILSRHPELELVFDEQGTPLDNPPVIEITEANPRYSLGALERLAVYQQSIDNKVEAAKVYWQIYTIMIKAKLWQGVLGDLRERCREKFDSLYKQLIAENLNHFFAPSYSYFYNYNQVIMCPIPSNGGIFDEERLAQYNVSGPEQMNVRFLAPRDKEIAEVAVTIDTDVAQPFRFPRLQIDCMPFFREQSSYKQLELNTGKQTTRFQMAPYNRAAKVYVNAKNTNLEIEIKLRKWFGLDIALPVTTSPGTLVLDYFPDPPEAIYIDGQKCRPHRHFDRFLKFGHIVKAITPGIHAVELHWKGGIRKTTQFNVDPGKQTTVHIYSGENVISRTKVADKSGNTYLKLDQKGKIWLLWDQAGLIPWSSHEHPSESSDIYYATSIDGVAWSEPRKLTISSSEMDMKPILQQDGLGTYWLVWCSHRDPDDPQRLWIASSTNGTRWTFPRKIKLPIDEQDDLKTRLELPGATHYTFCIDYNNNLWIFWRGHYYKSKSEDSANWTKVDLLSGGYGSQRPIGYADFITCDYANRLLIFASRTLWRQNEDGLWKNLGNIADESVFHGCLTSDNRRYIVAYSSHMGLFVKKLDPINGWSKPIWVENHFVTPAFPSVAILPEGNILVAYSSVGGLVEGVEKGLIVKLCVLPQQ